MLALMLVAGACLGNLIIMALAAVSDMETASTYGMLISYPVMFIPAMLYVSYQSGRNRLFDTGYAVDSNNFGRLGGWLLAAMAAVATLAGNMLSDPLSNLLPPMSEKWKALMESLLTDNPLWVTVISTVVFAPIFEEWLCRGMILRGLLQKIHPAWAMVISALFFALIHGNPWQALPAFLLGMLFAYVYYRTGSLRVTMLMHAVNNGSAVIISQTETARSMGVDASLLQILDKWQYIGLMAASLFIIVIFIDILKKNIPMKSFRGNIDTLAGTADNEI